MLNQNDLIKIKQVVEETAVTKEDAKNLVTKEDAKNFLTKEDAKIFATKDDLKNLVTKEDAKSFATKKDLIGLARGTEIDALKIEFIDKLAEWKSELYTKVDKVLQKI